MSAPADPILMMITGGDTAERDGSAESARHLHNVLREEHQIVLVELARGTWTLIDSNLKAVPHADLALAPIPPMLADLRSGRAFKPDAAIISIHGRPGETGELQAYLDLQDIAYNGPGLRGAALASDKCLCKGFLAAVLGVETPPHVRFGPGILSCETLEAAGMKAPLVIKPNDLGSAIGVLSVHATDAIGAAIAEAAAVPGDIIVESFVEGMELTVGAARFRQQSIAFEIAEVVRPSDTLESPSIRRYTSRKLTRLEIPARIPETVTAELHKMTAALGEALDIWGVYRADYIWDGTKIHFLEVNTIPGTSEDSVLIRQARATGLPPPDLFRFMVEDVLARHAGQK